MLASCDSRGPALLEENKPFTRRREPTVRGRHAGCFQREGVQAVYLPFNSQLSCAGEEQDQQSECPSPKGSLHPSASNPSFQLNQHFPLERQLDKEIHVWLRRTKSVVKARYHTPGISAIPIEQKLSRIALGPVPGLSEPPRDRAGPRTRHRALCALLPKFQPQMCCRRSCLLLKPRSSPQPFSECATVWTWPGMCRSSYSDEQRLGEVLCSEAA